jgi:hypothetical protein
MAVITLVVEVEEQMPALHIAPLLLGRRRSGRK